MTIIRAHASLFLLKVCRRSVCCVQTDLNGSLFNIKCNVYLYVVSCPGINYVQNVKETKKTVVKICALFCVHVHGRHVLSGAYQTLPNLELFIRKLLKE